MIDFKRGFTLVEILIVVAVIVLLSIAALVLINPQKQLAKAWDVERKKQLAFMQKVFEDYYNDNEKYPIGATICHDSVDILGGICTCHMCGREGNSDFKPYLTSLYCDPQYPRQDYIYQYDCAASNPKWFRMCATLSTGQKYGVASPGTDVNNCSALPACASSGLYCWSGGSCNICDTPENCGTPGKCDSPLVLYSERFCQNTCE